MNNGRSIRSIAFQRVCFSYRTIYDKKTDNENDDKNNNYDDGIELCNRIIN